MPELPEVEVVKKSLERTVKNLSVKSIKINDGNLRNKVKKHEINKIKGLKILKIRRRSKYLLIFFSQDLIMLVHFGMTGKFFMQHWYTQFNEGLYDISCFSWCNALSKLEANLICFNNDAFGSRTC